MGPTGVMRDGDDDQLMTSIKIDALWVVLDSLSAHTDMIDRIWINMCTSLLEIRSWYWTMRMTDRLLMDV